MKFVVAGGGVAGLAAALAVARAGHEAVVLERDRVEPQKSPEDAFDVARHGIPHFFQPRPVIEWALRRAAAAEPGVELRSGSRVLGLLTAGDGPQSRSGSRSTTATPYGVTCLGATT